jgi:hypothetical protein
LVLPSRPRRPARRRRGAGSCRRHREARRELRARGVDHGTTLFGGYNIVAWKPYFPPPRRTWERDADDLAAVVQGVDGRFPMRPGVASFLRTHHDELEHFTVDELQVWIHEHGSIRERDGLTELPP